MKLYTAKGCTITGLMIQYCLKVALRDVFGNKPGLAPTFLEGFAKVY